MKMLPKVEDELHQLIAGLRRILLLGADITGCHEIILRWSDSFFGFLDPKDFSINQLDVKLIQPNLENYLYEESVIKGAWSLPIKFL